ncbi:glycosyltransferase family 4 protein [Mitsuokella jalaludinii]|uniref:glycosyltransferase family 4 protein n=1 Tax=Mitsuokella jalaludinii TaxID=187979 RepID=UPI00298C9796|nr:glycosyltransferase family 4 protein [Mitsuokella jalaludinii]
MNIIIVNDFAYADGGASRIALDTAKIMATYGHNVIFFSAVGPVSDELNTSGITTVCLEQHDILREKNRLKAVIRGIYNKRAAERFREVLLPLDPYNSIIHIHTLQKAISSSIISVANEMNFKIIYHLHDYGVACPNLGFYDYQKKKICHRRSLSVSCLVCNCDRRSLFHKWWRVLRQGAQYHFGLPRKVDAFVAISEFSLHILKPYLAGRTVYMLPNLIDAQKGPRVETERNHAFLYVGRLSAEKGVTLFAEAAARLHVHAIFVGAGEEAERIKEIYPDADMRGWLSHAKMESVWREGLALVFPSRWYEGQPLTVCEALAHGIPAIVPTKCAAMDSIENGKTGLLFQNGSLDSLMEAMQQMMSPNMAKIMGENAYRQYWRKKWDTETYYSKLIGIYREVLEGL